MAATTPKRIALFMDGTWNTPESDTNVHRLYDATATSADQIKQYFPGVGTSWGSYLTGGLLAVGMKDIIYNVYKYLAKVYVPGDKVYLFGFSRGAFEVRALVGFIDTCGLAAPESAATVDILWDQYELVHKNTSARSLDQLLALPETKRGVLTKTEAIMVNHCTPIAIHFVGIFDVVAADPRSDRHRYGQNPTKVGRIVHAMAIDEHRESFQVMYCEEPPKRFAEHMNLDSIRQITSSDDSEDVALEDEEAMHFVEQRWFAGVHSNIGGGFSATDVLSLIPLRWVQQCAIQQGLAFKNEFTLDGTEHLRDSEQMDIDWKQRVMMLGHTHLRKINEDTSVNETIDKTVFERYQNKAMKYAPENLMRWASSRGLQLDKITPANLWAETGSPVQHHCKEDE
ncbi:hypothetical protein SPRG_16725 [Saprolegnia parasitica CBS 223.65]|uniref:T6SS Phospholipase effector Tle1-like catalytic domain-containing protein n=1 Tax=Saprolegnia parasitica (strain CBS 223.65) TaxID=695850 RepID=A0A067BI22_SAPPC|nr:hypothetical protein SPRG_16725 [Saprolegnia parasitica CBS 223.65]KDO17798.1 hypothetical protein SPRG_16725 [Saprolegnia parasitica CBS 223.65]|eukprot:XP_012211491.1 hypothetical protein SPRG_16725 [Saprolegnia parasitica CBS 223.65]